MWLAFVKGIHRWPVDSPQKGPVTWKMFPLDDVIMTTQRPLHLRGVRAPAWFDVPVSVLSALVYLCVEITHFHSGKIGISNFLTGLAMFLHSWKLPTGGWVSGIQVLMYQQCLFLPWYANFKMCDMLILKCSRLPGISRNLVWELLELSWFTPLPWTKWLPFLRQHFQMHFLEWKVLYFD